MSDSHHIRRRKVWLSLVSVPVLLLVVVSIVASLRRTTANRRLEVAMSVADRDDPHWRLEDLIAHREQVPDAENSALVVARSFELLGTNWPAVAAKGAGMLRTASKPIEDAFDRLETIDENVRLDDALAGVLREELKVREPALAVARTVKDYGRGRHGLVFGPNLIDTPLPHIEAVRSVTRLLEADAAVRANDGDLDGALDSSRAIFGSARSIGDEPMLISQLVRSAIDGAATKSVRRALGQGEASDAALGRLQTMMLDEQSQPHLLIAVKGERAFLTELIRRMETGETAFSNVTGSTKPPSAGTRFGDNVFAILARSVLGGQRAIALEWMNEAVAISRRPATEQSALLRAWDAKIAAVKRSQFERFTAILPLLLAPSTSAASGAFSRAQAELGATAILIAAERQRRRTGKWPASIKAIDPSIMPAPPLDPFTGEPFHFEHRDGQLFIYSIGPNGKDERGAFDLKRFARGRPDDFGARAWDVKLRGRAAGATTE
jgi:hypothetical protein